MTNDELSKKYADKIGTDGVIIVDSIRQVNHRPDVFTIGARHVAHAADHCCGMLGEATMKEIPCAACHRPYSEHESDRALVVRLTRNCTGKEISAVLFPLKGEIMDDKIDGVAFITGKFTIDK